jgi:hypothetical protein
MGIAMVTRKSRGKVHTDYAVYYADSGTGAEGTKYFKSQSDARASEPELRLHATHGTFNRDADSAMVCDGVKRWHAADQAPRKTKKVRPATATSCALALERYILPRWGAVRLNRMHVSDV